MSGKVKFFDRVGKTRIIPLGLKILIIFISLIILSNFATNFIAVQLSQRQILNLTNTIMVEHLKELFNNSTSQYQIYTFSGDKSECDNTLTKLGHTQFGNPNSLALALYEDGRLEFFASNNPEREWTSFPDGEVLGQMNTKRTLDVVEGTVSFKGDEGEYFGVYKYQADWEYYLIRAELRSDLRENNKRIYLYTSILIFVLTVIFLVLGYIILNNEFAVMKAFTGELIKMQNSKRLDLIDLSYAPNDDVTFMAASFNSLSSQVNNLLGTFQKFVSKDIVAKAYAGQNVGLEGKQQELTMLFSDVKSFTYRTETLGNDIIEVLNVHYNRVIQNVHENFGIVGSIIGDAILAIYGTMNSKMSKSYSAVASAWDITRSTARLRNEMTFRRQEIEKNRKLTPSEEKIFDAVMVDVGVGIDGGNVFYGTIGRNDTEDPLRSHMANTVIGDTVNAASRLEGLTRIYQVPVVVSEYVKNEVEGESDRYKFFEIDTVLVKGKTKGKKIYFPFDTEEMDDLVLEQYTEFEEGLKAYYAGDWTRAAKIFKSTELQVAQIFIERIAHKKVPEDWSGIWTITTK